MIFRAVVAASVTVLLLAPMRAAAIRQTAARDSLPVAEILDVYDRGDFARISFNRGQSVQALLDGLRLEGTAWVDRAPDTDRPRRRNILAMIALDAAMTDIRFWRENKELLEWACDYLRHGAPTPFEHDWMAATIALGELYADEAFLLTPCPTGTGRSVCTGEHIHHARERFPEDGAFRLGTVFGRRELNLISRRPVNSILDLTRAQPFVPLGPTELDKKRVETKNDRKRIDETFHLLDTAATDPLLGTNAVLRRGILHYELKEFEPSRRDLLAVTKLSKDPFDTYFAYLVMGLGFDADRKRDEAVRAYSEAVHLAPSLKSGALELAAHLFERDRRDEALAVLDTAFTPRPTAIDDPWQFPCAQCNGWTRRLARLHELVRR